MSMSAIQSQSTSSASSGSFSNDPISAQNFIEEGMASSGLALTPATGLINVSNDRKERKNIGKENKKEDQRKEADVKSGLVEFYATQDKLVNSLDGKHFSISKARFSLVDRGEKAKSWRETQNYLSPNVQERNEEGDHYRANWRLKMVEIKDVFEEATKKVLVMGPAGVGKTTFTQYVAYQWSKSQLWHGRFEYVFWIKLRRLIWYKNRSNPSLSDIIFEECLSRIPRRSPDIQSLKENIENILAGHSGKFLLILDGYDEIATLLPKNQNVERSFAELMACEHIILTTRPYRLDGLQKIAFDRQLQNQGLSHEQIDEYVKNYFGEEQQDKASAMNQWIQKQETVRTLAHIPVTLNILCALSDKILNQSSFQTSSNSNPDVKESKEVKPPKSERIPFAEVITDLTSVYREMVSYLLSHHYLKTSDSFSAKSLLMIARSRTPEKTTNFCITVSKNT